MKLLRKLVYIEKESKDFLVKLRIKWKQKRKKVKIPKVTDVLWR